MREEETAATTQTLNSRAFTDISALVHLSTHTHTFLQSDETSLRVSQNQLFTFIYIHAQRKYGFTYGRSS